MNIQDDFGTIFLILMSTFSCFLAEKVFAILEEDCEVSFDFCKRDSTDIGVDVILYPLYRCFGYLRCKRLRDTIKDMPFYILVSVRVCNMLLTAIVVFDYVVFGLDCYMYHYTLTHGISTVNLDTECFNSILHWLASSDCVSVFYEISIFVGMVLSYIFAWKNIMNHEIDKTVFRSTSRIKHLTTKNAKGEKSEDDDHVWMTKMKELRVGPDFFSAKESDMAVEAVYNMPNVEKFIIYWGRWSTLSDRFSEAEKDTEIGRTGKISEKCIENKDGSKEGHGDVQTAARYMPKLTEFGQCGKSLRCFPNFLRGSDSVKTIWIQDSSIKEIPEWVNEIPNLTVLGILDSEVECLPETLSSCRNLRVLDITGSAICELPNNGMGLTIEVLRIDGSQLPTIADSFKNLHDLKELYVKERYISRCCRDFKNDIPESIGELASLKVLSLRNLNETDLPSSVGNLINLEKMSLNESAIFRLPDEICELSKLTELDLQNTKIRKLPDNIGKLNNLKRLNLSGTELIEIPESIGKLDRLEILDLSYLKLEYIPPELLNLPLHHSVAHIPVCLLRRCKKKTIRYVTRCLKRKRYLIRKREQEGYIYFWNTDVKLPDIKDFEKGRKALMKTYKDCSDENRIYVNGDWVARDKFEAKEAGIMGNHAGENATVIQNYFEKSDSIDKDNLLKEITLILNELKEKTTTDEEYILIGKLSEAKKETEKGKLESAMKILGAIWGKISPVAEKVGCTLLEAIIKERLGL